MTEYLKVKDLYFSYHKNHTLKDINLLVEKGSFVTIIGPNGSGKSTLLKIISKVILPDQGEILFDSASLLSLKQKQIARKMAVVPQNFTIDFSFTVFETVLMGRTPFLTRFQNEDEKDMALAKWAMEITNTWHLKDRTVTELSGGELQRVIVARALTQEPKIILLDEPTAHLDIQYQMELLELLQSLNQTSGLTVIAVLHDLNLAAQFSQYMFLMKDGQAFAMGKPQEVLTAENIRDVYGMEIAVTDNPLTGKFNVIPLARSKQELKNGKGIHVHLICGGGTGIYILDRLTQLSYKVSCGVLNIGDSDWSRAKKLGLKVVEEAPFAPISEKSIAKNKRLIEKADCIIITSIPFGNGNLANLNLALEASRQGKPLLIVENEEYAEKDFTKGKAKEILKQIKKLGGHFTSDPQEIFDFLNQVKGN